MLARPRPFLARTRGDQAVVALPSERPELRTFAHPLEGGASTTVHVASYCAESTRVRLAQMARPLPLVSWCEHNGVRNAIVGGFFVRTPAPRALGEVWVAGERLTTVPFAEPWRRTRACVSVEGGRVFLAPRDALPPRPRGDLLQAGPLLVAAGRPLVHDGLDPEGFSAGRHEFDSDITIGRYPRAALGVGRGRILAVVCDGRSADDAGLTLGELARLMAEIGAASAINLDGGGSTSLVHDGVLRNTPREEHGIELVAGRPIVNALVFDPR